MNTATLQARLRKLLPMAPEAEWRTLALAILRAAPTPRATADGSHYWCARVPASLAPQERICAWADHVYETPSGSLVFQAQVTVARLTSTVINLTLPAGQWTGAYRADPETGEALAAETWRPDVTVPGPRTPTTGAPVPGSSLQGEVDRLEKLLTDLAAALGEDDAP